MAGTVAEFSTEAGRVTYGGRGSIANVSLQRIGQAFDIAALDKPDYESRVNGSFDVTGSGTTLAETTLDATGTLIDTDFWGARFPQLDYEAHLDRNALTAKGNGRFEHLDPARATGQPSARGDATGDADVTVSFDDVSAPITLDNVSAGGAVTLQASKIGELDIETADIQGTYAGQVGDIRTMTLTGPDLRVSASGRVAFDRTSSSDLTVSRRGDRPRRARQRSRPGRRRRISDARRDDAGNAASLQTTGTLNGSGLSYQENTALDVNSVHGHRP